MDSVISPHVYGLFSGAINPGAPVSLSVTVQGSDACGSPAYVPTNGSSGASLCVPKPATPSAGFGTAGFGHPRAGASASTGANGYTTERSIDVLLQRPSSLVAVARNSELHVGSRALHVGVQLYDATGRTVRPSGDCPGCRLELSLTHPSPPEHEAATVTEICETSFTGSSNELYMEAGVLDCSLQIPSTWFRPRQADRDWCASDGGASYRGTVATSVTGVACAPWSDTRRDVSGARFPGDDYGLEENFCRNHPDFASYTFHCDGCEGWERYQTRTGPWCYSTEEPVQGKEVRMPCAVCDDFDLVDGTLTLSVDGVPVATASIGSVKLHHAPVHAPLHAAGMRIEFGPGAVYEGDLVTAKVFAHTGGYALQAWQVIFTYDTSVLELQSYQHNEHFKAPTANHDTSAGVVDIAAFGTQPHVGPLCTPAQVVMKRCPVEGRGDVWVLDITLQVKEGLLPGCTADPIMFAGNGSGVVSAVVGAMLNTGGNQFVTNEAARIDGFVSAIGDALQQPPPNPCDICSSGRLEVNATAGEDADGLPYTCQAAQDQTRAGLTDCPAAQGVWAAACCVTGETVTKDTEEDCEAHNCTTLARDRCSALPGYSRSLSLNSYPPGCFAYHSVYSGSSMIYFNTRVNPTSSSGCKGSRASCVCSCPFPSPPPSPPLPPPASPPPPCMDTDNGAESMTMMSCASPGLTPAMCLTPAATDDDDFTASAMCCKCGGGSTAALAPTLSSGWYDRLKPRTGSLQSRGFAPLTLPTQPNVPAAEPDYLDGSLWRLGQGWLPILPEVEVGLFASVDSAQLLNTALLNGDEVNASARIIQLSSNPTKPPIAIPSTLHACYSADLAIVDFVSCAVRLRQGTELRGGTTRLFVSAQNPDPPSPPSSPPSPPSPPSIPPARPCTYRGGADFIATPPLPPSIPTPRAPTMPSPPPSPPAGCDTLMQASSCTSTLRTLGCENYYALPAYSAYPAQNYPYSWGGVGICRLDLVAGGRTGAYCSTPTREWHPRCTLDAPPPLPPLPPLPPPPPLPPMAPPSPPSPPSWPPSPPLLPPLLPPPSLPPSSPPCYPMTNLNGLTNLECGPVTGMTCTDGMCCSSTTGTCGSGMFCPPPPPLPPSPPLPPAPPAQPPLPSQVLPPPSPITSRQPPSPHPPPSSPPPSPPPPCTDTNNGAKSKVRAGCGPMTPAMCLTPATTDDDDFTASLMCCACGGGYTAPPAPATPPCTDTDNGATSMTMMSCATLLPASCGMFGMTVGSTMGDDNDFTASVMCCACGGGLRAPALPPSNPSPPSPPWPPSSPPYISSVACANATLSFSPAADEDWNKYNVFAIAEVRLFDCTDTTQLGGAASEVSVATASASCSGAWSSSSSRLLCSNVVTPTIEIVLELSAASPICGYELLGADRASRDPSGAWSLTCTDAGNVSHELHTHAGGAAFSGNPRKALFGMNTSQPEYSHANNACPFLPPSPPLLPPLSPPHPPPPALPPLEPPSSPPALPSCDTPPPSSPPSQPPAQPPACTVTPGILAPRPETLPAVLSISVWVPLALAVVLEDPVLSPILGVMVEPACSEQRWQTTKASAIASFGGEGLETAHGLDVTMLVTFTVDNTSVAQAHGNVISPRAEGIAAVVVDTYRGRSVQGGSVPSAGALVRVDHEPVKVEAIVALIVSEASWEAPGVPTLAPGSGVGRDAFGAFTATAVLSYRLIAEHDVANMYLWTVFNDTTRLPLAHGDAQGLTVRSLRPRDIGLVHSSLVTCTSSADPRTNYEIAWSLWCDGNFVTHGGAAYSRVVAIPRKSTHAASACTLTLDDSGARAAPLFTVSDSAMTKRTGAAYCLARGMRLAAIYDETELAEARATISAAGVDKAITAAESNGAGWTWRQHVESLSP